MIDNRKSDYNKLFITNGVTHAITLISNLFSNNNDYIMVEEPTYFIAINIFKEL